MKTTPPNRAARTETIGAIVQRVAPSMPRRNGDAPAAAASPAAAVPARVPVSGDDPQMPDWVTKASAMLEAKFPTARGQEVLDKADRYDYGRQFFRCRNAETAREALSRLRAKYTFRPSVAEVRAEIDALLEATGRQMLAGHDADARRIVRAPKTERLIAGTGETPGRATARQVLAKLARETGMQPPKPARTARFATAANDAGQSPDGKTV